MNTRDGPIDGGHDKHVAKEFRRSAVDMTAQVEQAATLRQAKEILDLWQRRNVVFGSHRFGDPAWDIMLELYVASLEGRPVRVVDLCGGRMPTSVLLRWIDALVRDRFITVGDASQVGATVSLSEDGASRLRTVFHKAHDQDGQISGERSPHENKTC